MTEDTPITRDPRVIVTGTRDSWMVARPVGGTLVLEIHQPAGEGLPDFCASIVLPSDQADALLTGLDGVWFDHYPEEDEGPQFVRGPMYPGTDRPQPNPYDAAPFNPVPCDHHRQTCKEVGCPGQPNPLEVTSEPFTGHPHDTLPTEAGDNPPGIGATAIPDPWATPTP